MDSERGGMTMRTLLAVLMMALAAVPASAQRAKAHFGLSLASLNDYLWENTTTGVYGGVSFDLRDYLRVGAFYVQKGSEGHRTHAVEVPVLYKRRIAESTHLLVGPVPGYGDYLDVGAVVGLSVRGQDRPIGAEVAFVYGLVPDRDCCTGGVTLSGHRVLRIGLEVPLR